MAGKHHKPILFDQILLPSKEQLQIRKAVKENRNRYMLYNALRITLMVIGTIVGSLAFTIAINALIQERSIADVAMEFLCKIERVIW